MKMQRAENQPTKEMNLYGGVFALTMTVKDAGTMCPQHSHKYDHMSAIMAGAVQVEADDVPLGVFRAPAIVKIAALTKHTFITLEPNTVITCIHAVALGEADFHEEDLVHEEHQLIVED
jgi:hypothetical protein